MTLNIHKASAWVLAVIIAAALSLAMGFASQTAYAEETAEDYTVHFVPDDNRSQCLPGGSIGLEAVIMKGDEEVPLPEGASLIWGASKPMMGSEVTTRVDYDPLNPSPNATLYVGPLPEGVTEIDDVFGVTVTMKLNGVEYTSDSAQFGISNDFYHVTWPDIDPYMAAGDTITTRAKAVHYTMDGTETVPLSASWDEPASKPLKIATGTASDGSIEFTITRKSTAEDCDYVLELDYDGQSEEQYYPLFSFSDKLSDYMIGIDEGAGYATLGESTAIYFIDDKGTATASIPAEDLCFVSQNRTVPYDPEQYDLTVKKYLGEDENTDNPKYSAASFPLTIDGKNKKDINGNRTDGTATYVVTVKAKEGSQLKGQLTDALVLQSKYTLCGYGSYVDFSDLSKYWKEMDNDPYWRFEIPRGVVSKGPVITMDEQKLSNTYFTIAYVNNSTKKVLSSFPKTAGTYTVRVLGKAPYYGVDTSVQIKVGLKNTITVKGKTLTIKLKNKAKKTKKKVTYKRTRAMTVKKAKGTVTYKKVKGSKKITVASNGKVTVKKGLKKGTYKIKVKVTAAGNSRYFPLSKNVTFKVRVK